MAVLALALYGAFLLIAGGMRALIQYRRTGDLGARHGHPGTAQWWGSAAPGLGSLLAGILAPAAEITGLVHPLPGLDGMRQTAPASHRGSSSEPPQQADHLC